TRDSPHPPDRQPATADILRAISQAQTEEWPVFQAIADSAQRLFDAWTTGVFRYDGEFVQLLARWQGDQARTGELPAPPRRLSGEWPVDRAIRERAVQHLVDVESDPSAGTQVREWAREHGWRSLVQVPMLRGNDALG